MNIHEIVVQSQEFFHTQETKSVDFRLKQLEQLKKSIVKYEHAVLEALKKDLGKQSFEAYTTEVGFVLSNITYAIKHLHKWTKAKKVRSTLSLFPSKGTVCYEPYGTVLIIGPFNYPFQLVMEPLIGAIAAGNCAVIKPSELTPNVSSVITEIINDTFPPAYIFSVEGGVDINQALLKEAFDYIFFTGSTGIGKVVMEAAAKHLTPVTLELGGKSPVIIDQSANLEVAAKRIIWGKTINAGQTCVAPDYIMVQESVKDLLVKELRKAIEEFFGENPETSKDLGRIVSDKHFNRLCTLLEKDKEQILYGGKSSKESRYIEPTLLDASWDSSSMQEEIFGPILPILSYKELDEAIISVKKLDKPLALYVFTNNKKIEQKVLETISSGGVCVNDVLTHIVHPDLPFGGVGASGIGAYHGKHSFLTFSHQRSILRKSTRFQLPFIFPPYTDKKEKLIRKVLK